MPWLYYGSPNSVESKTISENTLTNNTYGIYIDDDPTATNYPRIFSQATPMVYA